MMTIKREKLSSVEAANWWIRLRDDECTRQDRESFIDWLTAAPDNVSEYLALANVWQDLGEVVPNAELDAILAELSVDNVVLHPSASEPTQPPPVSSRRWSQPWIAIAAGVFAFVIGALFLFQQPENIVKTAVGEQRLIVLEDETVITLNTRTVLRYDMASSTRRVELIEGEALFDVARDTERPFIVTVGLTRVKVLGTSFNIYKKSDSNATITVLNGLVTVIPPRYRDSDLIQPSGGNHLAESGEVMLTDGEQINIGTDETIETETDVEAERVVEWTSRRISFENAPLKDVVAEFNRYNTRQLQVEGSDLAMLRLNGVFEPHSQNALLEYLRKTEHVHVRDVGNRRVISR